MTATDFRADFTPPIPIGVLLTMPDDVRGWRRVRLQLSLWRLEFAILRVAHWVDWRRLPWSKRWRVAMPFALTSSFVWLCLIAGAVGYPWRASLVLAGWALDLAIVRALRWREGRRK